MGKLADLVLWSPAFFGVKPACILKGGMIAAPPWATRNASIPTPQPVHYRPMFGAFGVPPVPPGSTFVSQAALDANIGEELGLDSSTVRPQRRGEVRQRHMKPERRPGPHLTADPQTYEVHADGELLTREPATGTTAGPALSPFNRDSLKLFRAVHWRQPCWN